MINVHKSNVSKSWRNLKGFLNSEATNSNPIILPVVKQLVFLYREVCNILCRILENKMRIRIFDCCIVCIFKLTPIRLTSICTSNLLGYSSLFHLDVQLIKLVSF